MEQRMEAGAKGRAAVPTETYDFSYRFEIGSLLISPVHVRVEQLRPFIAAHRHSNVSYEIHYAQSGRGVVTIAGASYDVYPGLLYVTGPGVVHMQTSDDADPVVEYCLYLNCRRASSAPDDPMLLFAETPFWIGADDGAVFALLGRLIDECRHVQCDSREMTEALLRQTILHLTRLYRREVVTQQRKPPLLTRDSFMPILEDAFFYRYRTLTLRELAGLLSLSVRQTQRLLLQRFGKTFSQKLSEARMAAACQFLSNTPLPITEIADRLGFSSIEHFSSSFRRLMGCPPTAYRKNAMPRSGENPL